ncbi:YpmS family protein [Ligilactobacillus animalis]|uniref:YpmS family protein n=1 Tax=Ligilactobacillus animalis TaxID=1605 RepID=A0AAJ6JZH0_9LACO|nr:YpmS family protein [Ligilactobacillus animalis]WHQ79338.1 YpmS family protein [Ligilactobacillus animalis]
MKQNPWKWAFAILLGLVLGFIVFVWFQVTTPSSDQKQIATQTTQKQGQYANVNVVLNKEQLSAAVNYYLQQNQKKGAIKYRFVLDKSAILMGTTKILGKDISFTLYATPQLDDSGNLELKTKSVAIGSLNAPPSFVLGYIKNNYDLGKWAKINASKATITLDLNQLTKKQGIKIQGEKFDLKQDDLQFKVAFPLSNVN